MLARLSLPRSIGQVCNHSDSCMHISRARAHDRLLPSRISLLNPRHPNPSKRVPRPPSPVPATVRKSFAALIYSGSLPYPTVPILSYRALPYPTVRAYPILPYPTVPTLSYLTLPCVPILTLPYPTIPYHTLPPPQPRHLTAMKQNPIDRVRRHLLP